MRTNPPTPEEEQEKTIKIAETCGWKWVTPGNGGYWEHGTQGEEGYRRGDWGSRELGIGLPDYFGSLDACAEMRKALKSREQFNDYEEFLRQAMGRSEWNGDPYLFDATPEQHCEAFATVLKLWKPRT